VYKLGKRLFFDRNGPIEVYGTQEVFCLKRTSPNEEAVGQDDPAILVNKLESSAKGCEWLRGQWELLKAPLVDPDGCWVGCHRLMAVRLLGRQPVNTVTDRLVAEVFVASFALNEDRENEFSDMLHSDLTQERLDDLVASTMLTWPGLTEIDEKSKGRTVLLEIVDQNIERLDSLIAKHAENADDRAESQFRRLGVDPSPESHYLRTHKAKCHSAYLRGQKECQNYKKLNREGKRAGGGEPWCNESGELIKSPVDRRASRRAQWDHANTSAAVEAGNLIYPETVAGCGDGNEPKSGSDVNDEHVNVEIDHTYTIADENEANFDEHVSISQEPMPVDVMANSDAQSGLDKGGKANFGEPDFERVSGENKAEGGVASDRGGERADGDRLSEPLREQKVVVGDRGRDGRGDRTTTQHSKKGKKRLRREMARREIERRRVAKPMESDPGFEERLGGIDSIFPDIGAVGCEHHLRSP
jgi:hypothetical protein